jgi:hypothetical protein
VVVGATSAAPNRAASTVVREEQIDVGRVDVEPDEVRERHAGLAEHGLQVVDAQRQLRRHVTVMLGLAVAAHRGLPRDVQGPCVPGDGLTLVESHLHRPRHRVDRRSFHCHISSIRFIGSTYVHRLGSRQL